MLDPTSLGRLASRPLLRRLKESLFSPTPIALHDAFITACQASDEQLETGFGDALSSVLAGQDTTLNEVAVLLVVADLLEGDADILGALSAVIASITPLETSHAEGYDYLGTLSGHLRLQVARRAAAAGSPLANWYSQLQSEVLLDEIHRLRLDRGDRGAPTSAETPALPVRRHWHVPVPRSPWFRGREEAFAFLEDALLRAPGQSYGLTGLGGIGKTQTAVEFAHRHRHRFSAVWLVDAATETLLRNGLVQFARRLGLGDPEASLDDELIRRLFQWLAEQEGWLLIFDSADDLSVLEHYAPASHGGLFLITSRISAGELSHLAKCIRLDALPANESRELLINRSARTAPLDAADEEHLDKLAAVASGLPLALEQMGAFLSVSPIRVAEYYELVQQQGALESSLGGPTAGGYPRTVATTWLSDLQATGQLNSAALAVLQSSAYWSPERIPLELLVLGSEHFSVLGSGRDCVALDAGMVSDVVRALQRFSLIDIDPGFRSYTVHPLVHRVVRESLSESLKRDIAQVAIRSLNSAFPSASYDNWPLCASLLPHAQHAEPYVDPFGFTYRDAGSVLNEAASFLRMRGEYILAEDMHLHNVRLARDSGSLAELATALNNLACVYVDVEEPLRASRLFKESLQLQASHGEGSASELWVSYNNIARSLLKAGLPHAAYDHVQHGLKLLPLEKEEDRYFQGFLLGNRAEILCALGRPAEARGDAERALAVRERTGNRQRIATSYSTLGLVQLANGDKDAAVITLRRSLELHEEVYGAEHPVLREVLSRVASALRSAMQPAEAAEVEERIVALESRLADLWSRRREDRTNM